MLKITVQDGSGNSKILLDGKLTGEWVQEMERVWHDLLTSGEAQNVTVDLSGLTFVDAKGKQLLRSIQEQGATLQAPQPLVKLMVH